MLNPEFRHLLDHSSEKFLLAILSSLSHQELLDASAHFGLPDCNCKIKILPCPKHEQWRAWQAQGRTAAEIVALWRQETHERVNPEDVDHDLERSPREPCDCSLFGRIIPCQHIVHQEYVFPFAVQILLKELLALHEDAEPPESLLPFDNNDHAAQVEKMRERVSCGLSPFHMADTIRAFPQKFVQDAHHGKNGRASGSKGRSLTGNYRREGYH